VRIQGSRSVPCGSEELTTHKFTSKERDSESYLDNFGARYFSSLIGRFMSPDWSSVPTPVPYADLTNPQTLNLYAMARDNPVSFADLDGHCSSAEDCPYVDVVAATEAEGGDLADANSGWNDTAQQQNNSQSQSDQQSSSSSGRVNSPSSGDPDSTVRIPGNKPGSHTDRTYGPDGKAVKDVDYGHDHGKGDPHAYDWDWTKARPRQPGRPLTPEEKQQIENTAKKVGFWGTAGVVTYWIISEGSRIVFPPRNLVPVP